MALKILKFEASVEFSHCHLMVGERACLMAVGRGGWVGEISEIIARDLICVVDVNFRLGGKHESICSSLLRGGVIG